MFANCLRELSSSQEVELMTLDGVSDNLNKLLHTDDGATPRKRVKDQKSYLDQ